MKKSIICIRLFSANNSSFHDSEIRRKGIDLFDYLYQVIEHYHLGRAWFSDAFNFFAYNAEMSPIINRSGAGFYGYIYSDDMNLLHKIQKKWLIETGARIREVN
ncbi:MAG: hypothetical protein K2J60_15500 [Acetatifactor sp.]|nr:hypothetical protein [Acetatifactor sp.]